jgi:hypothetical protein
VSATRVTLGWGAVLLVIAALQGVAELAGVASITNPVGLAVRAAFSLAAETVAVAAGILALGWRV